MVLVVWWSEEEYILKVPRIVHPLYGGYRISKSCTVKLNIFTLVYCYIQVAVNNFWRVDSKPPWTAGTRRASRTWWSLLYDDLRKNIYWWINWLVTNGVVKTKKEIVVLLLHLNTFYQVNMRTCLPSLLFDLSTTLSTSATSRFCMWWIPDIWRMAKLQDVLNK